MSDKTIIVSRNELKKQLEAEMEILQNSNAVWEHKKIDPPHVNTMKKAEVTSSDGKVLFKRKYTKHYTFIYIYFPIRTDILQALRKRYRYTYYRR